MPCRAQHQILVHSTTCLAGSSSGLPARLPFNASSRRLQPPSSPTTSREVEKNPAGYTTRRRRKQQGKPACHSRRRRRIPQQQQQITCHIRHGRRLPPPPLRSPSSSSSSDRRVIISNLWRGPAAGGRRRRNQINSSQYSGTYAHQRTSLQTRSQATYMRVLAVPPFASLPFLRRRIKGKAGSTQLNRCQHTLLCLRNNTYNGPQHRHYYCHLPSAPLQNSTPGYGSISYHSIVLHFYFLFFAEKIKCSLLVHYYTPN